MPATLPVAVASSKHLMPLRAMSGCRSTHIAARDADADARAGRTHSSLSRRRRVRVVSAAMQAPASADHTHLQVQTQRDGGGRYQKRWLTWRRLPHLQTTCTFVTIIISTIIIIFTFMVILHHSVTAINHCALQQKFCIHNTNSTLPASG